jgi:hypothetical protein
MYPFPTFFTQERDLKMVHIFFAVGAKQKGGTGVYSIHLILKEDIL